MSGGQWEAAPVPSLQQVKDECDARRRSGEYESVNVWFGDLDTYLDFVEELLSCFKGCLTCSHSYNPDVYFSGGLDVRLTSIASELKTVRRIIRDGWEKHGG